MPHLPLHFVTKRVGTIEPAHPISAVFILAVLFTSQSASAHPLSMSDVVVNVSPERVEIQLTILAEDLVLYREVSADGAATYSADALADAARKHWEFLQNGLILRDADGRRLPLERQQLDLSRIPEAGIGQADLKQHAAVYHFSVPLEQPLQFVTVSQKFGGDKPILPTLMDCLIKQSGVVIDTSQPLTAGQTHTVRFNWESPPQPLKNWRELRERRRQQLQDRLGIVSYSGFYSFLYIERREIRHEILVPLLTLEQWLPIERSDPDYLELAEQLAAQKQIAAFFTQRNPMTVNGGAVAPVVSRLNFFGLDIRDFALNAEPRRVSVAQARVGIILTYPVPAEPASLTMKWDTFHEYAPFLRTIVYEFDEAPLEHFFRPDEPGYQWAQNRDAAERRSRLAMPSVKPVKRNGSVTAVADAPAVRIAGQLVENVYHSFAQPSDEAVYDALATSVDGPLLRKLYLQILKTLLMSEQGNARSRLQTIQTVEGRLLESTTDNGFRVELRWRVSGSVEHWGHIHTRENEYLARISVAAAESDWRIQDVQFLDQKRVRFQTRLRAFESGL